MIDNQLTREKILAMEPGRELDALVAEKVMGYELHPHHRTLKKVSDGPIWYEIHNYSTDISAAFEALKKSKRQVKIEGHYHAGWEVTIDGISVNAWELPEAFCKCLLAVMDL